MDIPPPIPIPPAPNQLDAKLLKRARHAGRNLSVLAILATFGAIVLSAIAFSTKGPAGLFMVVLASTISLIAAGYWFLAVSARRGNPNAVGVVMVVMVVQIALAFISSGVAASRTNTAFQPPIPGLVIPVLVLIALASSRKVLLELKERNLWDQIFGSSKPSGGICVIGGTLLVTGFVALNAGSVYVGMKAGQERNTEIQHAKAFIALIKGEEQDFLTSLRAVFVNRGQGDFDLALAKFTTLEQRFEALKKESGDSGQLPQILATYGNALRQWKNGLLLLKEPNPDVDRVQKLFNLGDKLKAEAAAEFDKRYAPKQQQPPGI